MAPREREGMDAELFESIVVEALDTLPPEFARYLDNVEIQVEARPTHEHRRAVGLKPWQTLYGLYQGVPLTERSSSALVMPDLITLFQEPLERDFSNVDELRVQVRRTLLHEIAHFFGISDAELHELGAY